MFTNQIRQYIITLILIKELNMNIQDFLNANPKFQAYTILVPEDCAECYDSELDKECHIVMVDGIADIDYECFA